MKRIIVPLLFMLAGLVNGYHVSAQCPSYTWPGISLATLSTTASTPTINIYWNNAYVHHYVVSYQDVTTGGDWQVAAGNITYLSYALSINSAHNYNVEVDAVCFDGATQSSFRYNIAGAAFSDFSQCPITMWSTGFYSIDYDNITVNWNDAKADHYEVWYQLAEPFTTNPWEKAADNVTDLTYKITGLQGSTSYYVSVIAVCRDGYKTEKVFPSSITTAASPLPACDKPYALAAYPAATSAELGAVLLTYAIGVELKYYFYYNEDGTSTWNWVQWNDPGLNSSGGKISSRPVISNLKPLTRYNWFILMVCYSPYSGQAVTYSDVAAFKTLALPPGACGCTQGNFTAPALSNSSNTYFYCGSITDASSVTQSSAALTLKSTAVVLNPGFTTAVSGSGSFKAVAFNPNTCAATGRMNGSQVTVEKDLPVIDPSQVGFKVYPNPAKDVLNIQLEKLDETILYLKLTDVSGRTVLQQSGTRRLDISRLNSGIYIYHINTNKKSYTGKIIKE